MRIRDPTHPILVKSGENEIARANKITVGDTATEIGKIKLPGFGGSTSSVPHFGHSAAAQLTRRRQVGQWESAGDSARTKVGRCVIAQTSVLAGCATFIAHS
ncbi:MAG: hypothetical protein LC772_06195 [Chloroflexi bacterium]|nr:hypothetical protein [Chloroflexota bacterium]